MLEGNQISGVLMTIKCPNCETNIPPEDFNVSKDIAFCRTCDETFEYSSLVADSEFDNFDLSNPPNNIRWHTEESNPTLIYQKVSKVAYFLMLFLLMELGVTLFFIFSGFAEKNFGSSLIILIPFLLTSMILSIAICFLLLGKRKIISEDDTIKLFLGIGSLGRTQQFQIADVKRVALEYGNVKVNERPVKDILIELNSNQQDVRFGALMDEQCKEYFAAYIHAICNKTK